MTAPEQCTALIKYKHPAWDEWGHADFFANTWEFDLPGSGVPVGSLDYVTSEILGDPHEDFDYSVTHEGRKITATYKHTKRKFYQLHEIFARGNLK